MYTKSLKTFNHLVAWPESLEDYFQMKKKHLKKNMTDISK